MSGQTGHREWPNFKKINLSNFYDIYSRKINTGAIENFTILTNFTPFRLNYFKFYLFL